MKIYKISQDDIYQQPLTLLIGGSSEDVDKYIEKKHKKILEHTRDADAYYFKIYDKKKGDMNYIWIERFNWTIEEQCLLGHEILHFTFKTLGDVGIIPTPESEEAYTYFFQTVMEKVWTKLNPKK